MLSNIRSILIVFALLFLFSGCSSSRSPEPTLSFPPTPIPITPTLIQLTPSPTPQSGDDQSDIVAYIEGLAAQHQFYGTVLIGRDSDALWEYANGMANREANIPNTVDTQFNLGSMNKMFTGTAILQLMEQERLRLDDTIASLLPDYPNLDVANQVTVHQLLTHTSGLGDTFTEVFNANPNSYRANEDFLPLFVDEPLLFTPGEMFSYSNAGYVVLGLMIERLSGQSYDDYMQTHIFEPSGMLNTRAIAIEEESPGIAIGYTYTDINGNQMGILTRNSAMMPGRGFAAGGSYSTVGDLFRFRNALFGYRLLSRASTELLTTGKVQARENSQYAYGFFDRNEAGQRVVGHTGGAPGVCSFLSMYIETGYTVVVLSNTDMDCAAVLTFLRDHPLGR